MMPSDTVSTLPSDPPYVRPHLEPPMEGRPAAVERLLLSYRDLTENATPQGPSTGSHIPLTPHARTCGVLHHENRVCTCHLRSVHELERLLRRMRSDRPKQYRQLQARYIMATPATKDVPVKRKAKNGKTVTVLERQSVLILHAPVRREIVRKALEWLAAAWDPRVGEPQVPGEWIKDRDKAAA